MWKKFTIFCQVLKKTHTKENWFLFSASRYYYIIYADFLAQFLQCAFKRAKLLYKIATYLLSGWILLIGDLSEYYHLIGGAVICLC